MNKRILSILLAVLMLVSMIPTAAFTAFAAGTINTIDLTGVGRPIPGASVTVDPVGSVSAGANYTIAESEWMTAAGQNLSTGVFAESQGYCASFKLVPKAGYTFVNDQTALKNATTINGNALTDYQSGGYYASYVLNMGDYVLVRVMFDAYPVFSVGNVTVNGTIGTPITSTNVTISVEGSTFKAQNKLSDDIITNLPAGLTQTVTRVNDTTLRITVEGTPTAASTSQIEIDVEYEITTYPNDIVVNSNDNAKFNIASPVYGALTGTAGISGTAKYDEVLTASLTGSNNTGTLSYQWKRNGISISGATNSTYRLAEDDVGKQITVTVSSSHETGSVTSSGVTVEKADAPAAPTGLVGVKPSELGGNDGKITGVTSAMKWSEVENSLTNFWCSGTEITGLKAGTYYVYIAETATHKASASTAVVVPEGDPIGYNIVVNSGTASVGGSIGATKAPAGTVVTLTPNAPATDMVFDKWVVVSGGVTVVDDKFTMPDTPVEITATYKKIEYNVTYNVTNATRNGAETAIIKEDFVVKFTPAVGYEIDNGCIVVRIGGVGSNNWTFNDATDTLTITGTFVTNDLIISVTAKKIPGKFNVTWTDGTGYQITAAAGYSSPVTEGEDFRFVVTLGSNYKEGANYKVKANGVELTKVGGGYVIENITANTVITVEDVIAKPTYTVTLPTGTGFTATPAATFTTTVVEGNSFSFVVSVVGNYREGANFKVKANGIEITKIGGGTYTIENITENQVITVEGVEELPKYTVTWTDGTGYMITASTGYTSPVYEGGDFRFVVTLGGDYKEGANYKVKANGVELTQIGGGYVIENITANTVITVEDVIAKPTYTVTLPTGTGFTATPAATFTTTVVEGNDFSFVVSVVGNYREGANFKVKANGVEIVKSGDLYTIENITANQVITVEGVEELPKYTVTWTDGTGYMITASTGYTSPVYEGEDFRFVVTLGGNYKEGANYKVKANGVELTKVGGGYAIENITTNTVITVEDVIAKPTYTVTLPTGTGFTSAPAATFTTTIVEGNDFSFVVSVVDGYRATANFKVKANGVEIVKSGDLYTIENITANQVITVEGVEALPEYTITLPTGTGFTSTVAAGYTTSVVEGKDFHFVVAVTGNYREGANFKVKANGVELTKTSGYYAITNVTENQVITVEGVEELPKYSVTWTDGTGYMITASTGYTSPVYEGEDFRFVVTLGGNYKEGANFKVKANGVELTKIGGGYAIENITTNTVITVEDVIAKPTYTVTLPTGTGFTSAPAATFTTTIVEGNDFSFVVSVVDGYRATANFKVKANGVEIVKSGDLYTIENITANQVITVEGVEAKPTYTVTLPTGTGFTSAPAATYTTDVVEGKDFRFVVSITDGYRATADFKVKANGVEIAKVGDLYVIDNVTANTVITVEGVEQIPANDDNNGNTGNNNGNTGNNNGNTGNNNGNTDNNGGNTDNKPSDSPQTGDNSMMWLWVALLFVSGFGVVGTTVVRKKKTSVK